MRITAYALAAGLTLAPVQPGWAQDSSKEESSSGGILASLLEDTLSGDNRAIQVTGLEGALSSRATIQRITVSDDEGLWLSIEGAELDWNRLALVQGRFSVNALTADTIRVERAPNPAPADPELPAPEATPFQLPELPVSLELGDISAGRIELGEALLGRPAALSLKGSLKLADGTLESRLLAERLDRPGDLLKLDAGYANETRLISLDVQLNESADGLLATMLDLPGRPTLQFTAAGSGPVTGFTADIRLASNGGERLAGQVVLASLGTADPDTPASLGFTADLDGDVSPLLLPAYRPFFGPGMRASLRGQSDPGGHLALHSLALRTQSLQVTGALALAPGGVLETANLTAAITPPEGQAAVLLPVSGAPTTVGKVELTATKSDSAGWNVAALLERLVRPELSLAKAELTASGTLEQVPALNLDGQIRAQLDGFKPADPALAQATGESVTLSAYIRNTGEGSFEVKGLHLAGSNYRGMGDLRFEGLDSGLKVSGHLDAGVADLSRFAALAGHPIGGAASIEVKGFAAPLDGSFDAEVSLGTQDLKTGIGQLDPLIAGAADLHLTAARGTSGIRIDRFELNSPQLAARASGELDSRSGALQLEARLADLAVLVPQNPGPLELTADVTRDGRVLQGDVRLQGPHSSFAALDGQADLDGNADVNFEAALEQLQRFVPELAGDLSAKGRASRRSGLWQVDAAAKGPAGIEADVSGSWDESQASADLRAKGRMRLDAANFFISPNSVNGAAEFDLALKGQPGLEALSGTITTSGTSVALPAALLRIKEIGGSVAIAGGQAQLDISASPDAGGSLRVSGPVALTPPFDGQVQATLNGVVLTDRLSYETMLNGGLTYSGPLTGNGSLSGRIDVGETNINVAAAGGSVTSAPIPPIRHINEPAAQRATRRRAGLTEENGNGKGPVIGLDVLVSAPSRIFARGRGLNAELGGQIRVRGTTENPSPAGQISLIRGTFDILGRRLDLSDGQVTLQGNLKPHLDFRTTTTTSEGTATLEVSGLIDAPVIKVHSDPARPSEEALALLLFGDNIQELSPLALARLAGSVARLSGRGGQTSEQLREGLGAERLDLGADNGGAGLLGVGGYVADNVYTDFNVNTRGESELNVNLDVTGNVTVSGTVDSLGETGIGLFFKRDY